MQVTINLVVPSSFGTYLVSNHDYPHHLMHIRRKHVSLSVCYVRISIDFDFVELQVAMADRAHAYREHQDLLESYSFKNNNL